MGEYPFSISNFNMTIIDISLIDVNELERKHIYANVFLTKYNGSTPVSYSLHFCNWAHVS